MNRKKTSRRKPKLAIKAIVLSLSLLLCACQNDSTSKDEEISSADLPSSDNPLANQSIDITESETPYSESEDANLNLGWQLVWSDEFGGESIDEAKWGFEVNCWGGGNNERQCYTDREENAFIQKGFLTLVARKESFSGPAKQDDEEGYDPTDKSVTKPYTSARLRSKHLGDWKYGRIEVRVKPPAGQGSFPAIWLLPTDWEYGPWAGSGEIDLVEWVNLKTQTDDNNLPDAATELESRIHGTLHYGRAWPHNVYSGIDAYLPNFVNPADDFHEYAVEWEEGEIRWYVDNIHYATQRSSGWFTQYDSNGVLVNGPEHAPFNQRFHLIINNAVGGNWAENVNEKGVDNDIQVRPLHIDYVRVYQCTHNPDTGIGCGSVSEEAKLVPGHPAPGI